MKLFRNINNVWIISSFTMKKPCSLPLFTSQITPSRTSLSTSEVIWATSLIKEGQQYPHISFDYRMYDL